MEFIDNKPFDILTPDPSSGARNETSGSFFIKLL